MKKKIALSQIPVPEDLRSVEEEEYVAEMMRTVDRLGDIAAALFKHGIFCADDPAPLHECIDIVGKEAKNLDAIEAKYEASICALFAADLSPAMVKHIKAIEDVFAQASETWGEAGYLLGLAVGRRLSVQSSAIAGGVR